MKKIIFAASLILTTYANAKLVVDTRLEHQTSSDSVEQITSQLGLTIGRFNIFWPFEGERTKQSTSNVKFIHNNINTKTGKLEGTKLELTHARKYINKVFGMNLGTHSLTTSSKAQHTQLVYGSNWQHLLSKEFRYEVNYNYDLFYTNLSAPTAQSSFLKNHKTNFRVAYIPNTDTRYSLSVKNEFISDNNRKDKIELSGAFKVFEKPWIWLGVSADFITTKFNSPLYWTAQNLASLGPIFEIEAPISENFLFTADISLNRYRDNGNDVWGNGHYASFNFAYGKRDFTHGGIKYVSMRSIEDGDSWNSNIVSLYLTHPF